MCPFAPFEERDESDEDAQARSALQADVGRLAAVSSSEADIEQRSEVSVGAALEHSGDLVALPVESAVGRVFVPVAYMPSAVAEPLPTTGSLFGAPYSNAMMAAIVASLLGHFSQRTFAGPPGQGGFGGVTVNWREIIDEIAGLDAVRSRRLSEAEDLSSRLVQAGRVPNFTPGVGAAGLVSGVAGLERIRRGGSGPTFGSEGGF